MIENMIEYIRKIYKFIFVLRLKIKLMSDNEFNIFIKELDYRSAVYALYFRYK